MAYTPNVKMADSSSADEENAAAAVLALLLKRRRRDITYHDSKFIVKLPCK